MADELERSWDTVSKVAQEYDFERFKSVLPEEVADTFKDIKDFKGLASSYLHSQKAMGSRSENTIPGEKASKEEWDKFYSKLGVPASEDEYELSYEDVKLQAEIEKEIRATLKESKLSKKQADAVYKKFMELNKKEVETYKTESQKKLDEEKRLFEQTMGSKLDEANNSVTQLLKKYPDAQKVLDELGGTEYAAVKKMLYDLSKVTAGDNPAGPNDKKATTDPGTPRERLEMLKKDKDFMKNYLGGPGVRPEQHKQAVKTMSDLYSQIHSR